MTVLTLVIDSQKYDMKYALMQGRNHGIDIGGVQMWALTLPQVFFFKFSRGSDRKNKQARPSTNE